MSATVDPIRITLGRLGEVELKPTEQHGDNPAMFAAQVISSLESIIARVPGITEAVTGVKQIL